MYKVVWADTLADLERKVNDLMIQGWKPIGGVFVAPGNYFQAMKR